MAKKKYKTKEQKAEANEPQAGYGDKEIMFFNSFEEMNDYDHRQMALDSPLQRLQYITRFISDIYRDELKDEMDRIIHFK